MASSSSRPSLSNEPERQSTDSLSPMTFAPPPSPQGRHSFSDPYTSPFPYPPITRKTHRMAHETLEEDEDEQEEMTEARPRGHSPPRRWTRMKGLCALFRRLVTVRGLEKS
ncbi:hypothetical protein SISSUDRAFT_1063746 [Sistotremastrum suecicum HHB10207 ss-3]|uniref:Uncharacterized protein n=1 Tax=Sistotremastrum suecicum HHB10207 ss-3 TaxID=1314776 RepID=A0A166BGK8_9AGAM|nr:hypothetical protein SISSUDRAFT_1063746 [Sistotremastrum suecicum HHB10207 ss-3]